MHIAEQVPLAPRTTLRIGGPARLFAEIATESSLLEALEYAATHQLPLFLLGGGSNLLVPDEGFPGLVLHIAIDGPVERRGDLFDVPAGIQWDAFVHHVCNLGISGIECLAGIPGLVGASPIQNIGAYGEEVSQTIHSVRAYDRHAQRFTTLTRDQCGFAYRESLFNTTQRNRYIITRVVFSLDPAATPNLSYADLRTHFARTPTPPTPLDVYHAVRKIRDAKGMLLPGSDSEASSDTRSAGSFFKNPMVPPSALAAIAEALSIPESAIPRYPAPDGQVKLPAAWLLDQAGFHKSYVLGEAGISSRHTLALINRGHATCADIIRLRDLILDTIRTRFHLVLEQEPVEPRP
jgi:UDP-N-acetylmuramate dehydrogenase